MCSHWCRALKAETSIDDHEQLIRMAETNYRFFSSSVVTVEQGPDRIRSMTTRLHM